jgi:hypothetical protein
VTNQRVVIAKSAGARVKSFDIRRLPALELQEGRNGYGNIVFGESASPFAYGRGFGSPWADTTPRFARIENARTVYMMIREQAEA